MQKQIDYYRNLSAELNKYAREREQYAQRVIDAAIKERDTILGLYSKGQMGYLASWVSQSAMGNLKAQGSGSDIRQSVNNSAYVRETDRIKEQAKQAEKQAEAMKEQLKLLQDSYDLLKQSAAANTGLYKLALSGA